MNGRSPAGRGAWHLGSWLSALADGQLPPAQAERALAHVAACAACAAGLEAERDARRALAAAADVPAAPDLATRLMALSATVPPAAGDPLRDRTGPSWGERAPWEEPLTGDLLAAARRRRVRRAAAWSAGGLGVAAAALFAVGDLPVVVPDPEPQQALTLLARTATDRVAAGEDVLAGVVPASAAANPGTRDTAALAWVADRGWARPGDLPAGLDVTALRLLGEHGEMLEIDLSGAAGHVVVRQQAGRLAAGRAQTVAGRRVTVLSDEPMHVAFQSDDVVVDIAADVPADVLGQVLSAFPADGYDAGVLPRIARGWSTVRSTVTSTATGAQPQP